MPLVGVYAQLDPFYYVLEGYILPHPYHRTTFSIIVTPIVRFFLAFICVMEFARFALLCLLWFTLAQLVSFFFLRHIRGMATDSLAASEHVHKMYIALRLVFGTFYQKLKFVLSCSLFCLHAATVVIIWLPLKCWGLVPNFVLLLMVLFALVALEISLMLLPVSAIIHNESRALVNAKRDRYLYYYTNYSQKIKHLEHIKWRAQPYIGIPCGNLFVFKRSSTKNYFLKLVDNLTNALLLIDP